MTPKRPQREDEVEEAERYIVDDMKEDLEVCSECSDTWKVACYSAWCPDSQFWEDFLEDGWEEGEYSASACCLRFVCGMLFCVLAPVWCCKAIFCFLFWPCICLLRAAKNGDCNRRYFRVRRVSVEQRRERHRSEPLAYIDIEALPTGHADISLHMTSSIESIPQIRILPEEPTATPTTTPTHSRRDAHYPPYSSHQYTSPNGGGENIEGGEGGGGELVDRKDSDLPPPYSHNQWSEDRTDSKVHGHKPASKTMSGRAKSMDNNLYRAVVLEGLAGKVTSV